jgi:hypothetical protein
MFHPFHVFVNSASPSGAEFDGPEGGAINGPVEMISLEPEVKLTSTRRPVGIVETC